MALTARNVAQVVRRRTADGYKYEPRNPETVDGTEYHDVFMFAMCLAVSTAATSAHRTMQGSESITRQRL